MTMQPERASPSESAEGASFREIFENELDFVWNCLRRFGVPARDIEDEAMEVFLRVKAALGDFDPRRSIRPWMAGFAYRIACEYRRRPRHRFECIASDIDVPGFAPSPEEKAAESEERTTVMKALERVEIERRAVLVMHDVYGLTIPEVAQNCAIPLNTAYSRLRLARADFAQALKRLGWGNER